MQSPLWRGSLQVNSSSMNLEQWRETYTWLNRCMIVPEVILSVQENWMVQS
jgi:hypothetical protein